MKVTKDVKLLSIEEKTIEKDSFLVPTFYADDELHTVYVRSADNKGVPNPSAVKLRGMKPYSDVRVNFNFVKDTKNSYKLKFSGIAQ